MVGTTSKWSKRKEKERRKKNLRDPGSPNRMYCIVCAVLAPEGPGSSGDICSYGKQPEMNVTVKAAVRWLEGENSSLKLLVRTEVGI